ncbi:SgcJ/EcaC family oxidoreductase [Sphaerisporangium dianthi]|uniref:SgcJ/EcaC family oxidoreductase n=1 Tax=Sphaerisporangium dianthi TaxID=1436120 RepID=A0ABV9CKI3_9ACTN
MEIRRRRTMNSGLMLVGGAVMALSCALPPAAAATSHGPGGSDPDLAVLSDIWRRQAEAWVRGDATAYAAVYTPDADLVNIKGEHLHGRAVIAARLKHYFGNQLKDTRLLRLTEKIRMVSPLTAVIIRKDCVLYAAETDCRPANLSINSSVVVKRGGHWFIESFHNTLVNQQDERQRPFRTAAAPVATAGPAATAGPGVQSAPEPPSPAQRRLRSR